VSTAARTTTAGFDDNDARVGEWVDAAPFRAHLRHLMAVSGLSSSAVAVLADISPTFANRLLHGRGGRHLRRISPVTACKLLQITPVEARGVRTCVVSATSTRQQLAMLRCRGLSAGAIAELSGLSLDTVAALLNGAAANCTRLVALRVAVALSEVQQSPRPGQDTRAVA
jgi:hypothetical protein